MSARPKATESAEDYLERIYELIEDKGYARVIDIATSLDIQQASVCKMLQKLDEQGFVNYEKYRGLALTDRGEQVARAIKRRHLVLEEFFRLLGVDAQKAQKDVEGIEHHLSAQSIESIEALVRFLKENPDIAEQLQNATHA
jgi:Mn-dependent DtxR family transcriptional regulator